MMNEQSQFPLTISIALYKNKPSHIIQMVNSLNNVQIDHNVYFIDNSPTDILSCYIPDKPNYYYKKNHTNNGFGSAHNQIINTVVEKEGYHLVMNPDVFFSKGVLEEITWYMDSHRDIGLLLPRVLNPDKSDQPLFKLLPTPLDLVLRRFVPSFIQSIFKNNLNRYVMSFADTESIFDAPYLSGCFMFLRKKALRETGGFDERFFLYCEDIDLSRRINRNWRTTYYGNVSVYHYFFKGSYKYPKLLFHHINSSIKYFNKYGWLRDPERVKVNMETLQGFELSEKTQLVTVSK